MIKWTEETRPIKDLIHNQKNPRQVDEDAYALLKENIKTLGYHQPIAIQPDGMIISGHLRAQALRELGHKEVRVIVPDRPLTDAEYRKMLIQANLNSGTFDIDALANDFEIEELLKWGFDEDLLPSLPDEEESPPKAKKITICPHCGEQVS